MCGDSSKELGPLDQRYEGRAVSCILAESLLSYRGRERPARSEQQLAEERHILQPVVDRNQALCGVLDFRSSYLYIMNKEQVYDILSHIPSVDRIGNSGDWHFFIKCLVQHKHAKGSDTRPSMTVSYDCDTAWARCFACGHNKPLRDTLYELAAEQLIDASVAILYDEYLSKRPLSLAPVVRHREAVDYTIPWLDIRKQPMPEKALEFLKTKGVFKQQTIDMFGLAYVPANHSDDWMGEASDGSPKVTKQDGILLPVLDIHDGNIRCVGAQLRLMDGQFRYYAIYKFPSQDRLFGEHLLPSVKNKDLFLTEGPFDAMHIAECGFNAVALFGTHMHAKKAATIASAAPSMVHVLLDADAAGKKAVKGVSAILQEYGIPFCSHISNKDPKLYTKTELFNLTKSILKL